MKEWQKLVQEDDEQMDTDIQSMIEDADAHSTKVEQLGFSGIGTKREPYIPGVYSFKCPS